MISDLQEELVKVRLRDAENEAAIRDLKDKIGELEHVSKYLHYYVFNKKAKLI